MGSEHVKEVSIPPPVAREDQISAVAAVLHLVDDAAQAREIVEALFAPPAQTARCTRCTSPTREDIRDERGRVRCRDCLTLGPRKR